MAVSSSPTIAAAPNDQPGSAKIPRDKEWDWLGIRLFVVLIVLIVYVLGGNPIPLGYAHRDNAKSFVEKLYPDHTEAPSDRPSKYQAVVFSLIRSGDNADARRAIDFAADNEFGNASPYVIERLESGDGELRQSAHAFLVRLAGTDYGPSADAWRAWWHNPPRWILGLVPVGQRTLEFATPALVVVAGMVFWAVRRVRHGRPPLSWPVFYISFLCAWFMTFCVLANRLVGGLETCTFGSETIRYHTSHGNVLGLEDARLGGGGLFVLMTVLYLLVPAGAAGIWLLFGVFRRRRAEKGGNS